MINKQEVADRIKQRMKELNLKQIDIVEKSGISKPAMSNYMNAIRIPDTETILKLSNILDTSIEWILIGESMNVNFLGENETEMLQYFKMLPEREQIKFIGKIEDVAKQYENRGKLSDSKIG